MAKNTNQKTGADESHSARDKWSTAPVPDQTTSFSLSSPLRHESARFEQSWMSGARPRIDRFVLVAAAWAMAASGILAYLVYQGHPHIPDEVSFLLQARYFAAGKLAMAAPPVPKIGKPASFDPQVTANPPAAVPDLSLDMPAPPVADADADLSVDDLSTLPTEEAMDQISALAGFTAEDLAILGDSPAGEGTDEVQLPATFSAEGLDLSDLE